MNRPTVYLLSPVFRGMSEKPEVSSQLREQIQKQFQSLESCSCLIESRDRFPAPDQVRTVISSQSPDFLGCHLSHRLPVSLIKGSSVMAVSTATAGYNHVDPCPGILITHTPSVLHPAVADYTLCLILASLKSVCTLNRMVWNGQWRQQDLWDMDRFLGPSLSSLTLGIIGFGEIGVELAKRMSAWNMDILYHSRSRRTDQEQALPKLRWAESAERVFEQADIVSLHVPLTDETFHLVSRRLLTRMKPGALLVNTARGEVVDTEALLHLLEAEEITIHLAMDVFEPEPLPPSLLSRFRKITEQRRDLSIILMPHAASADADTRARMTLMMLRDLTGLINAKKSRDLSGINLIPEHRKLLEKDGIAAFRLFNP